MPVITLDSLETIMRSCAGEDEFAEPLADGPDQTFDELGYDSLAVLETYTRIKLDYGVELTDDDLAISTPRELVDVVNARLSAA